MFQLRNYIFKFSKLQTYTNELKESINNYRRNLVYVQQIPQDWNEKKLQDFIDPDSQYIKKVNLVKDSLNKFNCRAFIEMNSEEAVKDFMLKFKENKKEGLNTQTQIQINPLFLKIYRKRLEDERNDKKAYLKGLPRIIKNEDLFELAKDFGEIENISILKDQKGEYSRGQASIVFTKENDAKKFKYFVNGKEYMGRKIVVQLRSDKDDNREEFNENNKMNQNDTKKEQSQVDYSNLQKLLDAE